MFTQVDVITMFTQVDFKKAWMFTQVDVITMFTQGDFIKSMDVYTGRLYKKHGCLHRSMLQRYLHR